MSDQWYVRPSSMGRTIHCQGWINQAKSLKLESTTSPAAERGTQIHEEIAWIARKKFLEGEEVKYGHLEHGATIGNALQFIRGRIQDAEKISFEFPAEREGLGGTMDIVAVMPGPRLTLIDIKTGYHDPSPIMVYWQLATYAWITGGKTPVDAWWYNPDRESWDCLTFSTKRLDEIDRRIQEARAIAENPQWWRHLSTKEPDVCKHCPCVGVCPALRGDMASIANVQPHEPISVEQARRVAMLMPAIEKIGKAARKIVKGVLKNGGEVEGFELKTTSGARAIRTESAPELADVLKQYDITNEDLLRRMSLPFTKAQDLVSQAIYLEGQGKITVKESKKQADQVLEPFTATGAPVEKLVRKPKE